MKYSTALVAVAAGLVSAQTADDVPACAKPCITAAFSSTPCGREDYACICKPENVQNVMAAASPCVLRACGEEVTFSQVIPATRAFCATFTGGRTGRSKIPAGAPDVTTNLTVLDKKDAAAPELKPETEAAMTASAAAKPANFKPVAAAQEERRTASVPVSPPSPQRPAAKATVKTSGAAVSSVGALAVLGLALAAF